jgi:hypothetical protein
MARRFSWKHVSIGDTPQKKAIRVGEVRRREGQAHIGGRLRRGGQLGKTPAGGLRNGGLAEGYQCLFVVTSLRDGLKGRALYDWYVGRGEAKGWIKNLERALKTNRFRCRRFWVNQFLLLLHAAAYQLLASLWKTLVKAEASRRQLDTLRLRPGKIGGRVAQLLTKDRILRALGLGTLRATSPARTLVNWSGTRS